MRFRAAARLDLRVPLNTFHPPVGMEPLRPRGASPVRSPSPTIGRARPFSSNRYHLFAALKPRLQPPSPPRGWGLDCVSLTTQFSELRQPFQCASGKPWDKITAALLPNPLPTPEEPE
ncbi:hypothetical protein PAL_GLEAN10021242 [Pteropus alecto]|uniref:Uncharacterized protein n=1 Tax=Pteropus alecto TaxID=9402 RepID=L5KTF0_PTEAL|nr:hypothetical protein PAL_GLEAN10021242 [Pteropus alecto]